jgi:hypothetical protein
LADEKVLLGNVPSRSTLDFLALLLVMKKTPYVVGWLVMGKTKWTFGHASSSWIAHFSEERTWAKGAFTLGVMDS